MALRIVCDSAADLPAGLAAKYGIAVVPIIVALGDRRIEDSPSAREEFWAYASQGHKPLTSQPPSGQFREVFRKIVDEGDDVLCISITAEHSGTYNSARLGAMDFQDRVTLYDSRFVSRPVGLQVELAAKLAEEGLDVSDIVPQLEDMRDRTFVRFQLESLEYVRRGGRLDRILPTIDRVARALNVKPLLSMSDGELKLVGVSRSSKKGLLRMINEATRYAPFDHLVLVHARAESTAMSMRDRLSLALGIPAETIAVDEVGPSLASHGGPGLMALIGVSSYQRASLLDRVRQRLDI